MKKESRKVLSTQDQEELILSLKARFSKNMNRHAGMVWDDIEARLRSEPGKLWSVHQMESTGGEPDIVGQDAGTGAYIFFDCSKETPKDRRSICYDAEALEARKEFKPATSAVEMADAMGIELLTEGQYIQLQELGQFDTKTSSWIKTPEAVRKLGGALFADHRFGRVFVYHNGAQSYYAARGFRGCITI